MTTVSRLWYSQSIPGNDHRISPARLPAVHNLRFSKDVSRQALKTVIFVHFFNPPLNQIRSFRAAKAPFTSLTQADISLLRVRCSQGMGICLPTSVFGHTQISMVRGKCEPGTAGIRFLAYSKAAKFAGSMFHILFG